MERRQKIVDWLLTHGDPKAEKLLNALNQMDINDWETKYRNDLRKMQGWVNYESNTRPLRERARGEFDSYTDVPEWYLAGKAAKLGVTMPDLKQALAELQKEKEYFEGRERRKKDVKDGFKWNFASDWAKQRYIDTPEKSYWNDPEITWEHLPDIADAAAGFAAGMADFIPGIGGTLIGPTIRAGRNAIEGDKAGDVFTNYAADLGANAGVDYLPTLILNKARKVAKKGASQVEKYASLSTDIDNSNKALGEANKILKNIDPQKLRNLDPKEISKMRADFEALPDSPAKRDILKILDTPAEDVVKNVKASIENMGADAGDVLKKLDDVGFKIEADPSLNYNRVKRYTTIGDAQIKNAKAVPDAKFNPYNKQGELQKELYDTELGRTILQQKSLGQGMAKRAKVGSQVYKFGTKAGPGLVKAGDTGTGKRKPVKSETDRADIDWYKVNYGPDWSMGFKPNGREDEPIMKAYREFIAENPDIKPGIRISDVF